MPRTTPTSPASIEARRQSESLRKRKYRAGKRAEIIHLEAELRVLQDKLAYMKVPSATSTNPPPSILSRRHNENLKDQVTAHRQLARIMSLWTASQQPRLGLPMRSSWMQSTLMANPAGRQHGFTWLSDRVFHTSQLRPHPFGASVTDGVSVVAHRGEDDEGPTLAAIEGHYQYTAFVDYHVVADYLWNAHVSPNEFASIEMVEEPQNGVTYFNSFTKHLGTNMLVIARQYIEATRVVLVYTFLAHDECFPLTRQARELRPHGFAWTTIDHVLDNVTVVRHSNLQYAPITGQGVVTFAQISRMFGQPVDDGGVRSEARLTQLQTAAETIFRQSYQDLVHRRSQMFDPS